LRSALFVTTVSSTLRGFLLPFARHFRAQGWRVDAAATGISTCSECEAAFDHIFEVEWSRNVTDPRNLLHAPGIIKEIVKRGQYDIVHVHTPIAAFITRFALRGFRSNNYPKIIYTAHGFHFYNGGSSLKNAIFLGMERLAGHWTDYLVVINSEDLEAAHRYLIVPAERVLFMPGIGVDTEVLDPERISTEEVAKTRAMLGIQDKIPLFLMIAEFIPHKRHHDVLQAFARLNHSSAHLVLAGIGPQMEAMRVLADKLGIEKRVHFVGFRNDIPQLIRSSVAVFLPSAREGLPRSAMEALSLGIPVIGSDIRGTNDLLAGDCGLLVELGDIEGLVNAMTWVLENPEEASAMGQRGRSKMKNSCDVKAIIKLHEALYAKALGVNHALS